MIGDRPLTNQLCFRVNAAARKPSASPEPAHPALQTLQLSFPMPGTWCLRRLSGKARRLGKLADDGPGPLPAPAAPSVAGGPRAGSGVPGLPRRRGLLRAAALHSTPPSGPGPPSGVAPWTPEPRAGDLWGGQNRQRRRRSLVRNTASPQIRPRPGQPFAPGWQSELKRVRTAEGARAVPAPSRASRRPPQPSEQAAGCPRPA